MEPERDRLQDQITELQNSIDRLNEDLKSKDSEKEKLTRQFNEKIKLMVLDNNQLKKLLADQKKLMAQTNEKVETVMKEKDEIVHNLQKVEAEKKEILDLLQKLALAREQDAILICQHSQEIDKLKYENEILNKDIQTKIQECSQLTETLSFIRQDSHRSENKEDILNTQKNK